ncbi:hypothetical protein [Oceaniglobus roseus]|uniref:hypothetical protein n=1 Tax=Oceaniglobus roseus TaxID=1737570 RepID=UPI00130006A3|nr:hypothetical protein [Kandeliimicrobium roseum]
MDGSTKLLPDAVRGDMALTKDHRRWLTLALLTCAILIGVQDYRVDGWLFFKARNVSLRPDLWSGLLAIAMVLALHLRGFWVFRMSVLGLAALALNITVVAILVQALTGNTASWFTSLPMPFVLGAAVLLTWVGVPVVAQSVWLATVFFGIANLTSASDALGVYGFLMILFISIAFVLQANLRMLTLREFHAEVFSNAPRKEPKM